MTPNLEGYDETVLCLEVTELKNGDYIVGAGHRGRLESEWGKFVGTPGYTVQYLRDTRSKGIDFFVRRRPEENEFGRIIP